MPSLRKNIVSNQVIKVKADKLMKRAIKDAKRKIRQGELSDSHDLSLYLRTIDARYAHLIADINNATSVVDYAKIRGNKIAETRQLLKFFEQDYKELDRLALIVTKKAEEAKKAEDYKYEKATSIDLSKLENDLEKLTKEEF